MLVERGQCLKCKGTPATKNTTTKGASSSSSASNDSFRVLQPSPASPKPAPISSLKPPPPGSSHIKPPPLGASSPESSPVSVRASLTRQSFPSLQLPPAGTALYRGPYNELGQRHGQEGEMIWSNGDIYRGSFCQDKRQGHGTLSFAGTNGTAAGQGGEYVGDWQRDEMHGSGTRRYPNGDVYVGDYHKGKRHGEGRFYYANGDLYWGSWVHNQMNGPGRYYYAAGSRFEGTFLHGKRTGKGKLQRTDGTLEIFQYINDQRVGQGVRWSADRSKVWRLWTPKCAGASTAGTSLSTACLEKQRMAPEEAVGLVYDIEQAAACSMEGQEWTSS